MIRRLSLWVIRARMPWRVSSSKHTIESIPASFVPFFIVTLRKYGFHNICHDTSLAIAMRSPLYGQTNDNVSLCAQLDCQQECLLIETLQNACNI
jgi:hypothetical protein